MEHQLFVTWSLPEVKTSKLKPRGAGTKYPKIKTKILLRKDKLTNFECTSGINI